MIVPTMTTHELVKEVLEDYESVRTKANYLIETLRRPAIKAKNKYATKIFEYTSPKKNLWLIFAEHFVKKTICIYVVRFEGDKGLNAIMINMNQTLNHYTGHFFSRYNERYLNKRDVYGNDLITTFIRKNPASATKIIGKDDNGNDRFFSKLEEGIGLGYAENVGVVRVFKFKTFIADQMLFQTQAEENKKMTAVYENYLKEIYEFKLKKMREDE